MATPSVIAKVDPLLKIVELQERGNFSRSKAYQTLDDMVARGFSYLRIGGSIRVRESVFEKYLASCEVGQED